MSLTFFTKSRAYSWKISTVGHVLWNLRLVGACALTIEGKPIPTAAAVPAAAPPRNWRRDDLGWTDLASTFALLFICVSWLLYDDVLLIATKYKLSTAGDRKSTRLNSSH